MMAVLAYAPFIIMTIFLIFGSCLIINDVRDQPKKTKKHRVNSPS